jgi:hypothetical protein
MINHSSRSAPRWGAAEPQGACGFGERNLGLAPAKATCGASQMGKVVEHCDTIESIPSREQCNGQI